MHNKDETLGRPILSPKTTLARQIMSNTSHRQNARLRKFLKVKTGKDNFLDLL